MPVSSLYVTCMANTNSGANKVWGAMVLTDDKHYQYVAFWGRRHSGLQQKRFPFESRQEAFNRFSKVMQQKVNDGYKNVDPSYSTGMTEIMASLRKGPLLQPDEKSLQLQGVADLADAAQSALLQGITTVVSITPTAVGTILTGKTSYVYDSTSPAVCVLCQISDVDQPPDQLILLTKCTACNSTIEMHSKKHPHTTYLSACPGAVIRVTDAALMPPGVKANPAPDAIPHLECQCSHCMNSHGAVDGSIPCLVSTCKCEAYRHICPECDSVSLDGGWRHTSSCVTGYRLKPSQEVERGKRLPRRTSDLVDDV